MELYNMTNNNVLTITKDNFENEVVQSNIPVLIDFWAAWCAPCRMLSPAIETLAGEMSGKIKVGKINVDEQPELAANFRIMSIPTVILAKGNSVLMQSVGVKSKESLKREIESKI